MLCRRTLLATLFGAALSSAARAQMPPQPVIAEDIAVAKLTALAEGQLRMIAREPIVLGALADQNRITAGYSAAHIARLNGDWRREVYTPFNRTLIPAVLETPASLYLERVRDLSQGLYTEFMLMDAHGLNAALAGLTPAYWQANEDKFSVPFAAGARGLWIGAYELNTSTRIWQRQVSLTVVDPRSLIPQGVLCAGVAIDKI